VARRRVWQVTVFGKPRRQVVVDGMRGVRGVVRPGGRRDPKRSQFSPPVVLRPTQTSDSVLLT
jgi:hypothetical protein